MEPAAHATSNGGMIDILSIMHAEETKKIIKLPEILGVDLSITPPVVTLIIATLLICSLFYIGSKRKELVPHGIHVVVESIVLFTKETFVLDMIGRQGLHWWPFITALFIFILFNNILGLIPGMATPTSNINVTATLAIIVFLSVHVQGVVKHGAIKYLRGFVPSGIPGFMAPILGPFFFILELILHVFKPFALSIRLFANMFAGHVVLLSFIGLILMYKSYLIAIFPLALTIAIMALEIFFKMLQAYIFAILTSLYLSDAIHGGH